MRAFAVLLAGVAAACSPPGGKPAAARVAGGHVRDGADIMTAATERRVDAELARLEATTSDQVGVVTVPGLDRQPIERFSLAYARRWGLGQKALDNGVLILVAPMEHKVRIEVGTGLEGLLTDQRAKQIVDRMIMPFRRNDYDGGIALGVEQIETLLLADRRRPQRTLEPKRKAA